MVTDIERQFFETFNIEKRQVDCDQPVRLGCEDCKTCKYSVYEYPQITDRILLELICILNSVSVELKSECIKDLKQEILGEMKILLEYAPNEETEEFIKQQIQSLFKEG